MRDFDSSREEAHQHNGMLQTGIGGAGADPWASFTRGASLAEAHGVACRGTPALSTPSPGPRIDQGPRTDQSGKKQTAKAARTPENGVPGVINMWAGDVTGPKAKASLRTEVHGADVDYDYDKFSSDIHDITQDFYSNHRNALEDIRYTNLKNSISKKIINRSRKNEFVKSILNLGIASLVIRFPLIGKTKSAFDVFYNIAKTLTTDNSESNGFINLTKYLEYAINNLEVERSRRIKSEDKLATNYQKNLNDCASDKERTNFMKKVRGKNKEARRKIKSAGQLAKAYVAAFLTSCDRVELLQSGMKLAGYIRLNYEGKGDYELVLQGLPYVRNSGADSTFAEVLNSKSNDRVDISNIRCEKFVHIRRDNENNGRVIEYIANFDSHSKLINVKRKIWHRGTVTPANKAFKEKDKIKKIFKRYWNKENGFPTTKLAQ